LFLELAVHKAALVMIDEPSSNKSPSGHIATDGSAAATISPVAAARMLVGLPVIRLTA
jgi:hypothetical protein